jgi:lipoate-protein ligase A
VNSLWFIDDVARRGSINMGLDDIMAHRIWFCKNELICRTYTWEVPTLSYGHHQKPELRIDTESCKKAGVDLARRPTGGRELLHDGDLSFALVARNPDVNKNALVGDRGFFLKAARVIIHALKALGIDATVSSGAGKIETIRHAPCMAAVSEYEIIAGGKKLVPMAQRIYAGSILVHGSLPLHKQRVITADLLKVTDRERLQRIIDKSSTNLRQLLGSEVDITELERYIKSAFEKEFGGPAQSARVPEAIMAEVNKAKLDQLRK